VPGPEGDTLTLPYADAEFLADQIVGYGADVRVEGPPEVRDAVIQRLKEVVTQLDRAAPAAVTADSAERSPAAPADGLAGTDQHGLTMRTPS
jgi:WYL domain-containing protein